MLSAMFYDSVNAICLYLYKENEMKCKSARKQYGSKDIYAWFVSSSNAKICSYKKSNLNVKHDG